MFEGITMLLIIVGLYVGGYFLIKFLMKHNDTIQE